MTIYWQTLQYISSNWKQWQIYCSWAINYNDHDLIFFLPGHDSVTDTITTLQNQGNGREDYEEFTDVDSLSVVGHTYVYTRWNGFSVTLPGLRLFLSGFGHRRLILQKSQQYTKWSPSLDSVSGYVGEPIVFSFRWFLSSCRKPYLEEFSSR